jgi:hypothetical protein
MQPNQLVLPVDPMNNGTVVPETYERFEEFQNRSVYIGETHVNEARDTVNLYRSFPTKSGNFKGVAKTTVKLSKDVVVAGVDSSTSLTAPAIIEINFSFPVGMTAAAVKVCRQRAVAALDSDEIMDPLNNQLMV